MHKFGSVLLSLLLLGYVVRSEDVAFPSGITLQPVTEKSEFPDVESTGSRLFKMDEGGVTDSRRLSLSITVAIFRDAPHKYFRAHPLFIDCIQRAWTHLQNAGRKLELKEGFLAGNGDTLQARYRRSGTGVTIAFAISETTKDYKAMAEAFLRYCPPLFAPIGRDLGMIVEHASIFVYMTGSKSPSVQTLQVQGNPGFGDINAWARTRLNVITNPGSVPACGTEITALTPNSVYPAGAGSDPSSTVGPLDRPVTRTTSDPGRLDFLRLIQFPSDNIVFSGPPSLPNCPSSGGIYGNGPTTRCGPRLMAPRLFVKMNALQKMAQTSLSSKLQVSDGWTDAADASGVRREARQLSVRLVTNNSPQRVSALSRLARCVGFDYIKHANDHLVLAVIKQLKISTKPVSFPNAELVPVAAPAQDWADLYNTTEGIDPDDYPLFDSLANPNIQLSSGVPITAFRSRENDVRYFRVSNSLIKCYTEVVRWENRPHSSTGTNRSPIKVKIVRAYMSNMEEQSSFNPIFDRRLNKHTLGLGMHLDYENPPTGYDRWRLARTVATVCPAVFQTKEEAVATGRRAGLGIYTDGVYVDMRETAAVWFECDDCERLKPPGSAAQVKESLKKRMAESRANRIVDPNSVTVACQFDNAPKPQDPYFVHKHPEAVKRVRRSTPASAHCQLSAPESSFCTKSRGQRQQEINKLWAILTQKHMLKDKGTIRRALDGCLNTCTKCTDGPLWDKKVEHCNNLIHWIPFGFLNDIDGVITNLFPRMDETARQHACETGGHCVDQSPLFSILYSTLNAKFRPQPNKATQEQIFDPVENSSPLLGLVARLYALAAHGQAKLWLRNENDVAGMEDALRVLFVYNRNITGVTVYVLDSNAEAAIISSLESRLESWRTSTCPTNARETLAPYSVEEAPSLPAASQYDIRRQLLIDDMKFNEGGLRPDFI